MLGDVVDGKKTAFIEDTSSLTKKTKSDIVNFFYGKDGRRNNRKTAYLVRTDNKSKTSYEIKKSFKKPKRSPKYKKIN